MTNLPDTSTQHFGGPILPNLLLSRLQRTPDEIYLIDADSREWTYAEFAYLARRWVTVLSAMGVKPGDRVSVMLPNSASTVALWCALASVEALEVPINTAYKGPLLQHVLEDSGCHVAIVYAEYLALFSTIELPEPLGIIGILGAGHSDLPRIAPTMCIDVEPLLESTPVGILQNSTSSSAAATVIYTSGTTGPSKGVLVSWTQLRATSLGVPPLAVVDAASAIYSPYPMFHISGKLGPYTAMLKGARCIIRERFSLRAFWPDVIRYECTSCLMVGGVASFLAKMAEQTGVHESPMRYTNIGQLSPYLMSFAQAHGIHVSTVFNMTELSVPIASSWNPTNLRSCGLLRPGYAARVVDENDQDVPQGEIGELIVRSADRSALMLGYLGREEETARSWRGGWFHTGDLFRVDVEGNFYFVDRLKDAIRRRGENISAIELEQVAAGHPAISESAAVGIPSELGDQEVVLFVVRMSSSTLQPEEIILYLAARVPYFMVPRYVKIIDELPRTVTGKVRKVELRSISPADMWDRERAGITFSGKTGGGR